MSLTAKIQNVFVYIVNSGFLSAEPTLIISRIITRMKQGDSYRNIEFSDCPCIRCTDAEENTGMIL